MNDKDNWFDIDHQKRVIKVLEEMHAEAPDQFFDDLSRAVLIQNDLHIAQAARCLQRRDH